MAGTPEPPVAGERETAIVVEVVAPPLDAAYREAFPLFHARRIPLHVTLLYPWVAPEDVSGARTRLAAVLARYPPFGFALTELRTFPRTVWAAPEPAAPFVTLARDLQVAFPETPLYGGAFDEVLPHVTLADMLDGGDLEATLERLRAQVGPLLPVQLVASEVAILVEQEYGTMPVVERLPLG